MICRFIALFSWFILFIGCQPSSSSKLKSTSIDQSIRIVSLSPSTTELIALYAGPKYLKGRTQSCNYPEWVNNIPVVAFIKPNYEKLAEIAPTHIIYDAHLYSTYDIQKLQVIGAKLIPVESTKLEDFFLWLTKIKAEFPHIFSPERYIYKLQRSLDHHSYPLHPRSNAIKVALLYEDGLYREYYMAGTKTFQADLLKKLGCNVVGPHSHQFEKMSTESLVSLNPDLIFTVEHPNVITQDPRLKSIQAVQCHQVYQIKADILHRIGGRVDQLVLIFDNYLKNFISSGVCKK